MKPLILALLLSSPALAQDKPGKTIEPVVVCPTLTLDAFYARLHAEGDTVAGAAAYDGSSTDLAVIAESGGDILLFGFKDECLVGVVRLEPAARVV